MKLNKHNADLKRQRIKREKEMLKLYQAGMSCAEIGATQSPPISRQRVQQIVNGK